MEVSKQEFPRTSPHGLKLGNKPRKTCILNNHGYIKLTLSFYQIEVVKNSTSGNEWSSIDLKWRAPEKHPAGKITIRYSGPKPRQSFCQVEGLKLN